MDPRGWSDWGTTILSAGEGMVVPRPHPAATPNAGAGGAAASATGSSVVPSGGGVGPPSLVVREQQSSSPSATPQAPPATCEGAIRAYRESNAGPSALPTTDSAQVAVLENGTYLRECDISQVRAVEVCAATREGQAVGVTVQTTPHLPDVEACIADAVRRLSFASSPRLDVSQASFRPRW